MSCGDLLKLRVAVKELKPRCSSLSYLPVAKMRLTANRRTNQDGGYMLRTPVLILVPLLCSLAAQAQTKANCTFNFFSPTTPITLHNGAPVFLEPFGINDFGTVVGRTSNGTPRGLIRWANGSVTHVKGTSWLFARNDHGISVGFDSSLYFKAVLVNGTTITPIVLDVNNGGINIVKGINRWGTVIGRYNNPNLSGDHGFKRWKNGTTRTLDFPGALPGGTEPDGINDNGTVVGYYFARDYSVHGFIFHNGQWATLDYPNASDTVLVGITNAGKIIGNADVNASNTLFLYENGTFKVISVPNSGLNRSLLSISPKQGLILGTTDGFGSAPVFIAQCQ